MFLIKTLRNFDCIEVASKLRKVLMDLGLDGAISSLEITYLGEDRDLCAVTFKKCWEEEEGVMWFLGECACKEFASIESRLKDIVTGLLNLEEVSLVVATPAPFIGNWGPLTLLDVPTKIIGIKKRSLEESEFDLRTEGILYLALLAQGLISLASHAPSGIFLLELLKVDKILAEFIRVKEADKWILTERLVSDDYCSYVSESS